jgi:hypothetical protein
MNPNATERGVRELHEFESFDDDATPVAPGRVSP